MKDKIKLRYRIVLGAMIFVLAGIGIFYGIINLKKKEDVYSSPASKGTLYPNYILHIEQGQPWGKLKEPMQALANRGRMYIADTGNARVLVFDMKGKYLFELEEKEKKEKRRLQYPYGLAVDGRGYIYVADPLAGKVMIFNYFGHFVKYLNADNKFIVKPAGVFVQQDRIYVSDIGVHKVYVFNKQGKLLFGLGSGNPGNSKNDLCYPNGVIADSKGKIYISDTMNNRVQIFSKDGKYLETIGGDEDLTLINPRGIALDSGGNIFVANTLDNNIKVFDQDGLFLFEMNRDKNYSLNLPVDVSIDGFANIYVTDKSNNQILVFKR